MVLPYDDPRPPPRPPPAVLREGLRTVDVVRRLQSDEVMYLKYPSDSSNSTTRIMDAES